MSDSETRLARPVFFDRQSLTKEDLTALVDYVRHRDRRHNRHVHGFGVTCGLTVAPVKGAPWHLQVGEGHAILPSGEEVVVPPDAEIFDACEASRACLGIPGPCPAPFDLDNPLPPAGARIVDFTSVTPGSSGPNPRTFGFGLATVFDFDDTARPETEIQAFGGTPGLNMSFRTVLSLAAPASRVELTLQHFSSPPAVVAVNEAGAVITRVVADSDQSAAQTLALEGPGIRTLLIEAPQNEALLYRIEIPPSPVRGDVYLAICPDEEPTAFRPGIPPHCQPPGDNIHPSRLCEGYRFEILCDLPPGHAPPSCAAIDAIICGPEHIPCPPDAGLDCVVIATLSVGDDGIVAIDEFSDRRRVLPHWLLAEHAVCRCDIAPPPTQFTQFTRPSDLTLTSAPPTVFTTFTALTSDLTLTSEPPTLFTTFTALATDLTLPTAGPSGLTLLPSRFSDLLLPSAFPDDRVTGPISPVAFDVEVGRRLDTREVPGIGPVRADALAAMGINNVAELIETPSSTLADGLGISEVRVAELQDQARRLTLEQP